MNDWQLFVETSLPDDDSHLKFFVHNKGQMYIPKQDGAFGSFYFPKTFPWGNMVNMTYSHEYRLERTHLKTLDTRDQRCDKEISSADTITCITQYLESTIGCSMGLYGTDLNLRR